MARSPIPTLIEMFHQMSPEERRCFLDLVDPLPEPETPEPSRKRKRKKPATSGNSRRGLPRAEPRCVFMMNDGEPCTDGEHSPIHRENFGDSWHPFTAPATSTTAPRARNQSSASNGEKATGASSETVTEGAGDAAHVASGGD